MSHFCYSDMLVLEQQEKISSSFKVVTKALKRGTVLKSQLCSFIFSVISTACKTKKDWKGRKYPVFNDLFKSPKVFALTSVMCIMLNYEWKDPVFFLKVHQTPPCNGVTYIYLEKKKKKGEFCYFRELKPIWTWLQSKPSQVLKQI